YIEVVKSLLREGSVDFDGTQYHAHTRLPGDPAPNVPVMASALRQKSFQLCGEVADGAISWVCPGVYLRDVALPAMTEGASIAGRETPPLVAHAPVCVHENVEEVREAARQQLANYPRSPFYQQMFADSGYPEAFESVWSDGMIDAVVFYGNEEQVAGRLKELLSWGATEILAHPITAGSDTDGSMNRTLNLIAEVDRSL
ncbi:MAG: LLM class flavin-dependent oxidoreductase, partial [Dehalococcoidia bacterium]